VYLDLRFGFSIWDSDLGFRIWDSGFGFRIWILDSKIQGFQDLKIQRF